MFKKCKKLSRYRAVRLLFLEALAITRSVKSFL